MVDPGVVYIGKKPTMNYVLAVVTHFNGGSHEVVVRARGRSISRAVDVAEIVRGRFIPDAEVRDVRIAMEKVTAEDGRATNVSAIEIVLSKYAVLPRNDTVPPSCDIESKADVTFAACAPPTGALSSPKLWRLDS